MELLEKGEKVLLLWHKTFNKLMQPGGHIDPPDKNILEAIIREVKEETGLDTEIDKVFANGLFSSVPIILAINEIARNDKKKEAAHLHYDIWFLLKMLDESQETKNEDEGVENAGWVDISGINEKGNNVLYKGISKYLEFKDNNALLGAKNQNNNIYLRGIYILKAIESLQGKNIRFYFPNSQETMFVQLENSEKLNDLTSRLFPEQQTD
jgi:8-oxo-dGTP pyrophosphatase MutT (NUDIX family)